MKKIGKQPLFWDEELFRFLKIHDQLIIKRLTGDNEEIINHILKNELNG